MEPRLPASQAGASLALASRLRAAGHAVIARNKQDAEVYASEQGVEDAVKVAVATALRERPDHGPDSCITRVAELLLEQTRIFSSCNKKTIRSLYEKTNFTSARTRFFSCTVTRSSVTHEVF